MEPAAAPPGWFEGPCEAACAAARRVPCVDLLSISPQCNQLPLSCSFLLVLCPFLPDQCCSQTKRRREPTPPGARRSVRIKDRVIDVGEAGLRGGRSAALAGS